MAGETTLTLIGNLTADPELRYTASGTPVANFTVAATPRVRDTSGGWRDGETLFLRCTIWNTPAEHTAESLTKGARVIVSGRLGQRSYDSADGERRTVYELTVEEVGPSLRYATAKLTKTTRETTTAGGGPSDGRGEQPPF